MLIEGDARPADGTAEPGDPPVPPTATPGRRRRRWRKIVLIVAAALLLAYSLITVFVFVEPDLGSVSHPQAVFILGGYGDRGDRGVEAAQAAHVRNIEVSVGSPQQVCPPIHGFTVGCFAPVPLSTQGEARAIERITRQHHWTRILVVAGTTQVSRARLRISRCYSGQVAFAPVDPVGPFKWVRNTIYDQLGMIKAIVWQWGC